MPLGLAFWVIYLVCLIFAAWARYPYSPLFGGDLLMFLLVGILGWHSFGPPLHG